MRILSFFFAMMTAGTGLYAQNHYSLVDLEHTSKLAQSENETVLSSEVFGAKSPWTSQPYVHGSHPEKAKILALCSVENQGTSRRITIDPKVRDFKSRTGASQMVTAGASLSIQLPSGSAGKVLKVKVNCIAKGQTESFLHFFKGREVLKHYRSLSGEIPADADRATALLRLNGPGELALTKAVVSLVPVSAEEDVLADTLGFLDEKFYIPETGSVPMYFMLKKPDKNNGKVTFEVTLPEGVRILAYDKTVKPVTEKKNVYDISMAFASQFPGDFCCWRPFLLIVSSDRKLNGEEMSYRMTFNGEARPVHKIALYTMPAVTAPAPKEFLNGIMMQCGGNLPTDAAVLFTKLYTQSGCNFLRMECSPELTKEIAKTSVVLTGNEWSVRDGYPRTADQFNTQPFIGIDGKTFKNQICPEAVYSGKKVPRDSFQRIMKTCIFFMNNWEAYSSDYKGCFCNTCRDEFIKHSGLPADNVKKFWPKEVIAKYHTQWVKFRSWQHGLICKKLEELAQEARPDGHFMPMFTVAAFNESSHFGGQYHPDDYLKYLKWINVWGPYLHTAGLNRPYQYVPGNYLKHYYGVKNVIDYIRRHGGKDVNITGLPYGSHGHNVNSPEAIALETLDNFVIGYKGSLVYWFHFDYRYWALLTLANGKIAACESMVNKWPETKNYKTEFITPVMEPRHWKARITSYDTFPDMKNASSVMVTKAWSKGDSMLVAAGNFWERADVFFKLSVPGKTGDWVVRAPYAPYQYRKVTGKELENGTLLHVKPLIWEFFLVEPWQSGKDYGKEFSAEQELKERKSYIEKMYAEEDRLLAEFNKLFNISDYSFDETPEITAGEVTLGEKKLDGVQMLRILTPVYEATVAPSDNGNITSLKVNGKELVLQEKGGTFGKAGLWRPRGVPVESSSRFRIQSIETDKDHVIVTMDRPQIAGFDQTVVWKFYSDKLTENFTVRNIGMKSVLTVPRFHHRLMHTANFAEGKFMIGNEKFQIIPKERFLIQKPGILGDTVNVKGGDVVFNSPAMGCTITYHAETPLQGYYIYNSPGVKTGSFEPIYENTELEVGKSLTVGQTWIIKK